MYLDLDLDSTRIQVDALGNTPTPFWSVKSCHLCFFPGERHLSEIFLDCAYPVSSWSTWSSLETWNRRWSIRKTWPSQHSLLSLSMFSMLCCPVLVLNLLPCPYNVQWVLILQDVLVCCSFFVRHIGYTAIVLSWCYDESTHLKKCWIWFKWLIILIHYCITLCNNFMVDFVLSIHNVIFICCSAM